MKIIDILKEIINNKVKRRYILLFLLLLLLFLTGIVTTFVVVYKNRDVEFQKKYKEICEKTGCDFSDKNFYEEGLERSLYECEKKEKTLLYNDYTYIAKNVIITSSKKWNKKMYNDKTYFVLSGNVKIMEKNGYRYSASEVLIETFLGGEGDNIIIPGEVQIFDNGQIKKLRGVELSDFFYIHRKNKKFNNFQILSNDILDFYKRALVFDCKAVSQEELNKKDSSSKNENTGNRRSYNSYGGGYDSKKYDKEIKKTQKEFEDAGFSSDYDPQYSDDPEYEKEILEDYDSIDSGETPYDGDDGYQFYDIFNISDIKKYLGIEINMEIQKEDKIRKRVIF